MYTHRSNAPASSSSASAAQQQRLASRIAEFNRIHASQRKERIAMREQRHVAQCVLQDPELLLVHALTSNESILQTRRRFTAKFIAPDNPSLQESLLNAHAFPRTTRRDPDSDPSLSFIDSTLGAPRPRIEDVCELDDEKGWAKYQATKSKHHSQQRTPRKEDRDKDKDRARPKKRYKDDQSYSPSSAGARSPALSRSASGNLRQGAGSPAARASDTRRRWDDPHDDDDVAIDDAMEMD